MTGFADKFAAAGDDHKKLMVVYDELKLLPIKQEFQYIEPSDLETIRTQRPSGPRKLPSSLDENQWKDKFYGT